MSVATPTTSGTDPYWTDPNAEPRFHECPRCESLWAHVWYDRQQRWVYPKHDPCPNCEHDEVMATRKALDRRMRNAKMPHVGHLFRHDLCIPQAKQEPDEAFVQRVREANQTGDGILRLGVAYVNRSAVRKIIRHRWPDNLLLTGPSGTGKTLIMCAIARVLLQGDAELQRYYIDDHGRPESRAPLVGWDRTRKTAMGKRTPRACRYMRMDDLMERQSNRYTTGTQPVQAAKSYRGTLVLDELGVSEEPKRKLQERDALDHILGERHDKGRKTMLASNLSLQEIANRYGQRLASRLSDYQQCELKGFDWRA